MGVQNMMHGSGAIDAIREFRAEFGCGLMEAKVMWDRHHSLDKMREAMRESGIPELDNVRADRLQRELIELTALREAEAAELIELRMRFSDSVPTWIPVGERSPDSQYDVLVTDGEIVGIGDCCKGHLWNSPGIDGPVTHWMPLPEAP